MKICPKCGRRWPDKAKFCPVDGTTLEPENKEEPDSGEQEAQPSKAFSETKWFMIGDHIKDEDVTPEDIPDDDLEEIYKKTGQIPTELRKKYSLSFHDDKKKKKD